jgi:hypothetical protein
MITLPSNAKVLIVGYRNSGKSTLAQSLAGTRSYVYINGRDEDHRSQLGWAIDVRAPVVIADDMYSKPSLEAVRRLLHASSGMVIVTVQSLLEMPRRARSLFTHMYMAPGCVETEAPFLGLPEPAVEGLIDMTTSDHASRDFISVDVAACVAAFSVKPSWAAVVNTRAM